MRLPRPSQTAVGLDMTPMIDMTFQLIAFFMFTISFNQELTSQTVRLPVADVARPVENAESAPLFLNVDRQGTLLIPGGAISLVAPSERERAQRYLKAEAASAADGPPTTVIIRADESVDSGVVHDLIALCRAVGFSQFSLRADLKSGEANR